MSTKASFKRERLERRIGGKLPAVEWRDGLPPGAPDWCAAYWDEEEDTLWLNESFRPFQLRVAECVTAYPHVRDKDVLAVFKDVMGECMAARIAYIYTLFNEGVVDWSDAAMDVMLVPSALTASAMGFYGEMQLLITRLGGRSKPPATTEST